MKNLILKLTLLATLSSFLGLFANAIPLPPTDDGITIYNPVNKIIQGDQPLLRSYQLSITSPSNIPANTSVTVDLNVSILTKPLQVSDADTLSFLTVDETMTFTGPNQTLTTTVTLDVPLGNVAGAYAYLIKASGWPQNLTISDIGATINALVYPADVTNDDPPAVDLQTPADGTVYTYYPVSGNPVDVPITFEGSVGPNGKPISGMLATINGTPLTLSSTGIGTNIANATTSAQLTVPGTYVIEVSATNLSGTSYDSHDISVVIDAPPPTITVASPVVDAAYSYDTGEPGATVSVSYDATSLYGNITATAATLNGSPVALDLSGVGTDLVAVGSATLTVAAGSHVLSFTASNEFGDATVVEVPFTVKEIDVAPIIPTVTIITPVDGSVFERTEGDDPTVVDFTYEGGTTGGTIESVTVMIDGVEVSSTVNGLNTADITGSGSESYSAAGTHTLTVTVSNGQATATDSTTFTIEEKAAELCANLRWLAPICYNKVQIGGKKVPIKFTLTCDCKFVREESLHVSVYEVFDDGTFSEPKIYSYGTSMGDSNYIIYCNQYKMNFQTEEGVHRYRVEVYYPLNDDGTSLQLLGTKDIVTKAKKQKSCKSWKSDKSGKSWKSNKSDKSDKSGKSWKSNKSDKSDKSSKWWKSKKSDKSDKSDKSAKSNKSSKWGKSDKSGKSGSSWSWSWSSWSSWSWWK